MDKREAFAVLQKSQELYVIFSACTRMPFVVCDPETCDDEIFVYEKEEDIKREMKRFLDQKQPVQFAKIPISAFLNFYGSLFTMGVNCLVLNGYTEREYRVQIAELVKKPGSNQNEKNPWIENPGFHLTTLYFSQEVRRQKLSGLTEELKDMLNEIQAGYSRGTFLLVHTEDGKSPLLKLANEEMYQPVFTDLYELQKFNRNTEFKAAKAFAATVIPEILAKEARGVIVNPMGVAFQIPLVKKQEQ